MNAASSNIKIETAEIPRAALGPDERAYTLHPLNNSILSLFLVLNIDLVFFSLLGSGDQKSLPHIHLGTCPMKYDNFSNNCSEISNLLPIHNIVSGASFGANTH